MAGYEHGGWRKKYIIQKRTKEGFARPIAQRAKYFVLRFDKDPHARVAMSAYADSVESVNPQFAEDIRKKIGPHNRRAMIKRGGFSGVFPSESERIS